MWVLLRSPRFGGAKHASGHDNRCSHRQVGFSSHGVDARRQLRRRYVLPLAAAVSRRHRPNGVLGLPKLHSHVRIVGIAHDADALPVRGIAETLMPNAWSGANLPPAPKPCSRSFGSRADNLDAPDLFHAEPRRLPSTSAGDWSAKRGRIDCDCRPAQSAAGRERLWPTLAAQSHRLQSRAHR
jgi:hypothetical protein